jgi:sugar lactone lactonase YvrE
VGSPLAVSIDYPAAGIVWQQGNTVVKTALPSYTVNGITIAGGNGGGGKANQLNQPISITVDKSGNLYVADQENHRVQRWAPGAAFGVTVAGGNGAGNNPNQFNQPFGVAVDDNGNLYVTDMLNHRVQRWAPGATEGVTVAGSNGVGGNASQFDRPAGIIIDESGNLYVADGNNHRIQQFSPTIDATYTPAEAGTYTATVRTFNGCTAGAAPVAVTEGLPATLSGGGCVGSPLTLNIAYPAADIVWRKGTAVVKTTFAAYPANGVSAAGGNGEGSSAAQLSRPYGVAADGSGNVYVADVLNHRIQKWAPGAAAGVTVAGGNGAHFWMR